MNNFIPCPSVSSQHFSKRKNPFRSLLYFSFLLLSGAFFPVFSATINVPADQATIQDAVDAASPGDIILVAPGIYNENVTINKSLTLISSGGRDVTFINGSVGTLGTIFILNNTNNVTIGGYGGQGFTIKGFDSPNPGLETAAVYIQGTQTNITIRGNELVADGEAALLSEYGSNISTLNVNVNIISGKTFVGTEPGGCGFGSQFTTPNVPRSLVYIGQATNVNFTSNDITGIAGGASSDPSCSTYGQGNTLVTIFGNTGNGAVIRGNVFAGTTTRFGSHLRVRGTNASIIYNTFEVAGLGDASFQIDLTAGTPLTGATPGTIEGVASLNTFADGAYYSGAKAIYKNSAQVSSLAQTPIPTNSIPLATVSNSYTGERYGTIQSAIDDPATTEGHTILAGAATYNEDVLINKSISLQGAGCEVTTIVGQIGGDGATVRVAAGNVLVDGFTITREGNTVADWNNPNLNFAGIAVQGQTNSAEISNNKITGNRTAIDINNSNGNNIHNNVITNNHTGIIFRNQTDNTNVSENEISENRTVGILFLDASGGTNSPVQSAANSTFNNNSISGNWYGQIVDRQAGGNLPSPGTNLKNFECNWYGTISPTVTTANSAEPGYASLIPVEFGGTATDPGGQPEIAGPGSANFDYIPLLNSGTDTDAVAKGFQPAEGTCVDCSTNTPPLFGTIAGDSRFDESLVSVSVCQNSGDVVFTYLGCEGGTVNWTGTDNSSGTGNIVASSANVGTVIYSATCTLNGCVSEPFNVDVTVDPLPTVTPGGDKIVYLGYGTTCTTISATASGGSGGNYTYSWMPGNLSGASVEVCPTDTTIYTVTVTDENGCTATAEVTVTVIDVRCGNKNDKVLICHKGKEICVSPDAVADHLGHGDYLGSCTSGSSSRTGIVTADLGNQEDTYQLVVKAYPNPSSDVVNVEIQSKMAGTVQLDLLDVVGRPLMQRTEQLREGLNELSIKIGGQPTGIYLLRCRDLLGRQAVLKISKN